MYPFYTGQKTHIWHLYSVRKGKIGIHSNDSAVFKGIPLQSAVMETYHLGGQAKFCPFFGGGNEGLPPPSVTSATPLPVLQAFTSLTWQVSPAQEGFVWPTQWGDPLEGVSITDDRLESSGCKTVDNFIFNKVFIIKGSICFLIKKLLL